MYPRTERILKAANKNAPSAQKRILAIGGWIIVGLILVGGVYYLFSF
jgi:hypothetical protein